MKLTLSINFDNAAFEGSPENEVARILLELAHEISMELRFDGKIFVLRDYNGNTVGKAVIK